jgi:thymidine phosphorylase
VLDVKVGEGAFMKSRADAETLAEVMLDLGRRAGREVVALITDMDQPLGHAVGNALEIREAISTLRGDGPRDFVELVVEACAQLLALSDLEVDHDAARERVEAVIADGSALARYERWIEAQGGDPDEEALPRADVVLDVEAPSAGHVARLRPVQVGIAALGLGAGRRTKEEAIDYAVGVVCHKKRGDAVEAGELLAQVHARDEESAARAAGEVAAAYELGPEPPGAQDVILGVLTQ